jgi:uncharacterized protein (DUF433 family)
MSKTGSNTDRELDGTMPRIVQTDGVLGGDPRIEGRRIGVIDVFEQYTHAERPPEDIARVYDLSVAEVHAALAYALENRERMEAMSERRTHRPEAD